MKVTVKMNHHSTYNLASLCLHWALYFLPPHPNHASFSFSNFSQNQFNAPKSVSTLISLFSPHSSCPVQVPLTLLIKYSQDPLCTVPMATFFMGTSSPADFYDNCVIPIHKSFSIVPNTASLTILTKRACCSLFKIIQWVFIPSRRSRSHDNVLSSPLLGPSCC